MPPPMEMNFLQCHRIFQPADRRAAISGSIMGDERTDAFFPKHSLASDEHRLARIDTDRYS